MRVKVAAAWDDGNEDRASVEVETDDFNVHDREEASFIEAFGDFVSDYEAEMGICIDSGGDEFNEELDFTDCSVTDKYVALESVTDLRDRLNDWLSSRYEKIA